MFGTKNRTEEVNLMVELPEGTGPGKILDLLSKFYVLKGDLEIDMKIIISTAGRNLPPVLVRKLLSQRNWKELLFNAKEPDHDYRLKEC